MHMVIRYCIALAVSMVVYSSLPRMSRMCLQALSFIFISPKSYHSPLALSIANMPFFVALALFFRVPGSRSVLFAITAFLPPPTLSFLSIFNLLSLFFSIFCSRAGAAGRFKQRKKNVQTCCRSVRSFISVFIGYALFMRLPWILSLRRGIARLSAGSLCGGAG